MFKGKVAPQNSEILKCALSLESSLCYLAKENIPVSLLDFLTAPHAGRKLSCGYTPPTYRTPRPASPQCPTSPSTFLF